MFRSFSEYIKAVFGWWRVVLISNVLGGGQFVVTNLVGIDGNTIPIWVWVICALIGFLVANFLAFHKVRKERDELKEQSISETEYKLRELRLKVRNTEVAEIPDILITLYDEVVKIMYRLRKNKVEKEILESIVIKSLGLRQRDLPFLAKNDERLIKFVYNKFGVTKHNYKRKLPQIQLRISEHIDNHNVGISSNLTKNFVREKQRLMKMITSNHRLDEAIYDYLDKLISLHNIRLYIFYVENLDDKEAKEYLNSTYGIGNIRFTEKRIERDVKKCLTNVGMELEKYQTGERVDE